MIIYVDRFSFSNNLSVERMSTCWDVLWSAVGVEMFASSIRSNVSWMVALETSHIRIRQYSAHVGIFSVSFLEGNNNSSQGEG